MMAEPKNNLFISLLICFILFIVLFDETKVQIVADILKKHAILINSKERERKLAYLFLFLPIIRIFAPDKEEDGAIQGQGYFPTQISCGMGTAMGCAADMAA
ncbi:MAG: hypothetical protein IKH99_02445 [Prevotella sp.]|nr:hypothetical protein [Prevotella sp.]